MACFTFWVGRRKRHLKHILQNGKFWRAQCVVCFDASYLCSDEMSDWEACCDLSPKRKRGTDVISCEAEHAPQPAALMLNEILSQLKNDWWVDTFPTSTNAFCLLVSWGAWAGSVQDICLGRQGKLLPGGTVRRGKGAVAFSGNWYACICGVCGDVYGEAGLSNILQGGDLEMVEREH